MQGGSPWPITAPDRILKCPPNNFFKQVASLESIDRIRIKEIGQPRKGKGWEKKNCTCMHLETSRRFHHCLSLSLCPFV
jgi:hypothetical protein